MKKFLVAVLMMVMGVVVAPAARADSCGPGYYYNANNECVACQNNHYCTGDGTMQPCPAFTYDNIEDLYPMIVGYNVHSIGLVYLNSGSSYNYSDMTSIDTCRLVLEYVEVDDGRIREYKYGYSSDRGAYDVLIAVYWDRANAGYYLSPAVSWSPAAVWYGAKACTNSHPANSHYSGPGTPDSKDGTIVNANDCPWECDAGYYNNNGTCTACPTGYTSNAGATAENQCFITVAGGHYIGTAGQNSTNWGTCAAGYARAEHTVNYGSTSSCDKCTTDVATGRPAYSDTAGASSCTPCPAVTGELVSRVIGYSGWWSNDIHNAIYGCVARFGDDDPSATFTAQCYYSATDNAYGGPNSICQVAENWVRACAAGKYNNIKNTVEWYNAGGYTECKGVDCMKNKICTSCPENTYSPEGATTCTACLTGLYSPAGMWESAQCGHILHVGDDVVYLRATKKTSPSVHVKIGNDIFYGNMTTADVPMNSGTAHKLKLNYGGTTYSVYDDTVNVN